MRMIQSNFNNSALSKDPLDGSPALESFCELMIIEWCQNGVEVMYKVSDAFPYVKGDGKLEEDAARFAFVEVELHNELAGGRSPTAKE